MKKMRIVLLLSFMLIFAGCGKEETQIDYTYINQFRQEVNAYCEELSHLNEDINSYSQENDANYISLLNALNSMNELYSRLSDIEVPTEYASLETLFREASDYMNTAYISYYDVYTQDYSDPEILSSQYEYATENYDRAYKRLQIIISLLNESVTPTE